MKKILVYTSITGEYDDLIEIKPEKNVDYYCFTNNPNLKSKTWNIVGLDNSELLDNVRLERKCKILGCPELEKNYDIAVYMDANIKMKKTIHEFIEKECDLENYDFCQIIHNERDCIYEEAEACKIAKKDNNEIIDKTIKFLKKEKFPHHYGLTANCFFVRKTNNLELQKIQKEWWDMVKNYSRRDQLSLMYILWKNNYQKQQIINLLWHNNKYYKVGSHNITQEEKNKILINDNNNLKEQIKIVENENNDLKHQLVNQEKEKIIIQNQLNMIINSKSWKFITKFRNIYNSIFHK